MRGFTDEHDVEWIAGSAAIGIRHGSWQFLQTRAQLTETQIGVAMAMVSAANLISPTLLTLLADTLLQTRQILALAYGLTSLVLVALLGNGTVTLTLMLMAAYGLSIVAMFPLQDLLNLGSDARMNTPGTVSGNWSWRVCTTR